MMAALDFPIWARRELAVLLERRFLLLGPKAQMSGHENAPLQKHALLSEDRYGQSLPWLKQDGRPLSN
jgi:hypothetical protein